MQLGTAQGRLKSLGVESVGVVNTTLQRAQLYFKFRPSPMLLAADPDAEIHRQYRLPAIEVIEDEAKTSWPATATMGQFLATRVNPSSGPLPEPSNPFVAMETVNKQESFELTEVDQQIVNAHGTQLTGHFLIDRAGIIRWAQIEAGTQITDLLKFPTDEQILSAARAL